MSSTLNSESESENDKDSLKPLYLFFTVIVGFWILAWVCLVLIIKKPEDRGLFGDMFGGVNALFSGLALAGIIYTILLQKKELGLQRKELRETRKEFSTQNETLRLQRFENTFFQLINLHHELIDHLYHTEVSLIYVGPSTTYEKREVLSHIVDDLSSQFNWILKNAYKMPDSKEIKYVDIEVNSPEIAYQYLIEAYQKIYFVKYKQLLSNYYRSIYHIFKFIKTSSLISESQRKFYASIVRAQLSSDELFLILYNGLIPGLGHPNFLYLIRELDIMQNFDLDLIEQFKFHLDIYNEQLAMATPEWTI